MSSKWPSIVPLLKTVVSLAVSASLLTSGSYATDKDKDDNNFIAYLSWSSGIM